jgi:hypothetical protein
MRQVTLVVNVYLTIQFLELGGFNLLSDILEKSELTLETFEILFDLMCDGVNFRTKERVIKHRECLVLVLDLLLQLQTRQSKDLQKQVLGVLVQLLSSSQNWETLNFSKTESPSLGNSTTIVFLRC